MITSCCSGGPCIEQLLLDPLGRLWICDVDRAPALWMTDRAVDHGVICHMEGVRQVIATVRD